MCPGEWWHKPEVLQDLKCGRRSIQHNAGTEISQTVLQVLPTAAWRQGRQTWCRFIYTAFYVSIFLTHMKYHPEMHLEFFVSCHAYISRQCLSIQWICTVKQLVLQTWPPPCTPFRGFLEIGSGLNTYLQLWCLTHTLPVQFHPKEDCWCTGRLLNNVNQSIVKGNNLLQKYTSNLK